MRKLTLLILITLAVQFSTMAQMEKGSWILRGNIGINYDQAKYDEIPNSPPGSSYTKYNPAFTLSPGFGRFITDHLAVGINGTYGRSRFTYSGDDITVSELKGIYNTFGVGLFIRKYAPVNDKISFFVEANGGRHWIKPFGKNENGEKYFHNQSGSVDINGVLGVQYLVTKNIGLDFYTNFFRYSSEKTIDPVKDEPIYKSKDTSFNLGSGIGMGLNLFF